MSDAQQSFDRPSFVERLFNRGLGSLVRLGVGFRHTYLLEVRGRKSGRRYTTPVDVLTDAERRFLVAPRGYTQWVRNAQAAAEVTLRRGGYAEQFYLRVLSDAEKPPILKAYLERFRGEVQRFFPVPAGSPVEAFAPLAQRYPAFELLAKPLGSTPQR